MKECDDHIQFSAEAVFRVVSPSAVPGAGTLEPSQCKVTNVLKHPQQSMSAFWCNDKSL